MLLTQWQKYFLIAFLVVVFDQASKMLVFNNMELHEEINVLGDWFRIHYLLNPGMAFGIKWNSEFGKLALTLFRIAATFGIAFYLYKLTTKNAHPGLLFCTALILGGAVGNVIDSTFYGVLLNNAPPDAPTPWFHGQVIDMFFFPLFDFVWPEWVPWVGGQYFLFFSPVFNLADSCIFIGVAIIFLRQKSFFKSEKSEKEGQTNSAPASETSTHPTPDREQPTV